MPSGTQHGDLLDCLSLLDTQHQAGIVRHLIQPLPIAEQAIVIGGDNAIVLHIGNEVAEQALVEKLRRIQAEQDRHPLGQQRALFLQFSGADLARAVFAENAQSDVVALDRLDDEAGQNPEPCLLYTSPSPRD